MKGKGKIESITVAYRDGLLHVNIDGFMPKNELVETPGEPSLQGRLELFQKFLSDDIGEPVVVELDFIPIDIVEMRAGPTKEN